MKYLSSSNPVFYKKFCIEMNKADKVAHRRPEVLEGAPLQYAPENELGVVFLFSHIAKKLRIKVEQIRPQFPDCIAYQRTAHGEKRIRIEFEFCSSNFKSHNHSSKKCDWIVCWGHDWPGVPEGIRVVELKKYFGVGFKVWIQPAYKQYHKWLNSGSRGRWSVSKRATNGDVLLMYRVVSEKCIKDIFVVCGEKEEGEAGWRDGVCNYAPIKRVCKLKSPIFLEDLKQHRVIRTSSFVRCQMQGKGGLNATEYWPYLFEMIIQRNPGIKKKLLKYAPDRI